MAFQEIAALICALVSVGVGLAAMNVDLLRALRLNALRDFFQYIAGIAGAATLVYYFNAM